MSPGHLTHELRTVEDQLETVLGRVRALPVEVRSLADAAGFTLAGAARAANHVPAFDNAAMDGFAVRFAEVATATHTPPVTLRVIADVPAGSSVDPHLEPGTAVRIMTGAPMPTNADTVVPFEETGGGLADSLATAVIVQAPRAEGTHVRAAGFDAAAGATVLEPGVLLGARQLSALASVGVGTVEVARRPRVAIASTGSELVSAGESLSRGKIPDSNGILLAELAAEAGAEILFCEIVDDEGDGPIEAVVRAAGLRADAVIFSGGVSAGAYEPVRQSLGDVMDFVKVAMKPGKPQGFGATPEGMLLFGLPGNPVSAAVSFEAFVRPALLRMQGRASIHRPLRTVPAGASWRTTPGRRQYLPVVIDAEARVVPVTHGSSGSHLSVSLGIATAYAVIPTETVEVAVGDLVQVMELR